MKEFFGFAAFLSICLFMVFSGVFYVANELGRYQCENYQKIAGKQTKYVEFDNCYVNTPNGWQRWDEYKIRAAASEGLSK